MKAWRRKCRFAGPRGPVLSVTAEPDDGHVRISWVWAGANPADIWNIQVTFNGGIDWEDWNSAAPTDRTILDESRLTPGEQPAQYRVQGIPDNVPEAISNVVLVDLG